MNALSWNDFKLVKTIADAGNMAGAAEKLKVNHSTVFRQLAQVEKTLGIALFERHRTGYVLTPAGKEMTDLAERMDGDILDFTRKLSDHGMTPSGELRVTTNEVVLVNLLMPLLTRYIETYPDIRLEIVQANEALSLTRRDADIAIRATDAPPENLVGRKVGSLGWAVYGHSADFGDREIPLTAAEFVGQRWIGFGDNLSNSKPSRYVDAAAAEGRIVLRLNTVLGAAEAVENRIGIAALPCYIGDGHPSLTRLSNPVPQLETGLWLLTHADLRHTIRVRSFMDFIGAEIVRRKGKLEGVA